MLIRRYTRLFEGEPGATGAGAPTVIVTTPPVQEPATFSREYVSELRFENAGQRTARKSAEEARVVAETAAATAKTDADTRIAASETKANERIVRAELKAVAIKAGMVDLDGLKLADLSKVKLNDDGEVEGADAMMEQLKKDKPYLFGGVSTSTGKPIPKPGVMTAKKAGDMTPDEYKAARRDIARGILPVVTAQA